MGLNHKEDFAASVLSGEYSGDAGGMYYYAQQEINGRFLEAEPTIANAPLWSYWYALNIIKGRFLEGETAILSSEHADMYKQFSHKWDKSS